MCAYKEFKAKNIDLAIMEACRFFAVDRDSLEIDIVSGGSAGIFGLGAKKAVIRAKRRRLDIGRIKESLAESPLSGRPGPEEQPVEKGPEESSVDTRKGEEQESTEESEEPEDEDGEGSRFRAVARRRGPTAGRKRARSFNRFVASSMRRGAS